ncbi:MAG: thiamine phosphate synthase [Geminicoccaceae bacterium]
MTRTSSLDLRLYLVTDPDLAGERSLLDVVDEASAGGVGLVQLRDKGAEARDLLALAEALKALLEPKNLPLVVNDRVDVAAAAGVGCHIGQSDLPPAAAREILGESAIIGLSIDRVEQAPTADPACLDYVAHGPFAATDTKCGAGDPVGVEGIGYVRALTALPLVAIGGIGVHNAADAIRAGADGIAVVSAVMAARDPKPAALALRGAVDQSLGGRCNRWERRGATG